MILNTFDFLVIFVLSREYYYIAVLSFYAKFNSLFSVRQRIVYLPEVLFMPVFCRFTMSSGSSNLWVTGYNLKGQKVCRLLRPFHLIFGLFSAPKRVTILFGLYFLMVFKMFSMLRVVRIINEHGVVSCRWKSFKPAFNPCFFKPLK